MKALFLHTDVSCTPSGVKIDVPPDAGAAGEAQA
jgi:hypothetical protein